jgi:hypothetical protein
VQLHLVAAGILGGVHGQVTHLMRSSWLAEPAMNTRPPTLAEQRCSIAVVGIAALDQNV